MKDILRLTRRFAGIMTLSFCLLFAVNILLLSVIVSRQNSNGGPWTIAEETAAAVLLLPNGSGFALTPEAEAALQNCGAWAVLIDETTLRTVWQTKDLPPSVPAAYSASSIADLTRGYIDSYPTFTASCSFGLMVLGFPRESYWKHMWPSWDYQFIAHVPQIFLLFAISNAVVILLIYLTANYRLLRSIRPIAAGIQALPTGQPVHIAERGFLSGLAASLNRTSELLKTQQYELRRKETARANWIAGVSHDIRTPLSMVMGHAEQLKEDSALTPIQQKKAAVILRESERIRDLVSNLNLASKLEYNMQPAGLKPENVTAIVRQTAADFINADIEEKYPVEWIGAQPAFPYTVMADRELLSRAVMNLFHNCKNHNEDGCTIYVSVEAAGGADADGLCRIRVEDDGAGLSDEELDRLRTDSRPAAHGSNESGQPHGLGLLLVRQIAEVSGGTVEMDHSNHGGFSVSILLPLLRVPTAAGAEDTPQE